MASHRKVLPPPLGLGTSEGLGESVGWVGSGAVASVRACYSKVSCVRNILVFIKLQLMPNVLGIPLFSPGREYGEKLKCKCGLRASAA